MSLDEALLARPAHRTRTLLRALDTLPAEEAEQLWAHYVNRRPLRRTSKVRRARMRLALYLAGDPSTAGRTVRGAFEEAARFGRLLDTG